jgi:uncharacterized protein YaaQ
MKMILAIIPRDQADHVLEVLVNARYMVTFSGSRGGMLRQGQEMLFIVVDAERVENVLSLIRDNCRTPVTVDSEENRTQNPMPVTAELGGAVVFVWDVERIEKY